MFKDLRTLSGMLPMRLIEVYANSVVKKYKSFTFRHGIAKLLWFVSLYHILIHSTLYNYIIIQYISILCRYIST